MPNTCNILRSCWYLITNFTLSAMPFCQNSVKHFIKNMRIMTHRTFKKPCGIKGEIISLPVIEAASRSLIVPTSLITHVTR